MKAHLFLASVSFLVATNQIVAQEATRNRPPANTDSIRNEHFKAGLEMMDSGDYEKAITEFEALLRLWPGDKLALFDLGLCLYKLGKYQKCIDVLRRDPTGSSPLLLIGESYLQIARYDSAMVYFNKVLAWSHDNAEAYYMIAVVYYKKGDQKSMILNLQKAAKLGNKDAQKTLRDAGYGWE
jgi:tetratricopeptide (TPR) repeat protein